MELNISNVYRIIVLGILVLIVLSYIYELYKKYISSTPTVTAGNTSVPINQPVITTVVPTNTPPTQGGPDILTMVSRNLSTASDILTSVGKIHQILVLAALI